jgi:DNA-binding SARP family transcriptional activator
MNFKLLGFFEVQTEGGALVTPTARMSRRVLALLLLNSNTIVRFDQLMQELWEDHPPRSARTTMQTYIYHLRKIFGSGLVTWPSGYELRLGPADTVDVAVFDDLVARATVDFRHNLLDDAESKLSRALDLYRGPVLTDVEVGPVLAAEVHRLEERRRSALDLWLDINLEFGRHAALLDQLRALVEKDPTHEGFVGKLMLSLVRCGRRTAALDTYHRARHLLVTDYGLEPSAGLQELHFAILRDDSRLLAPTRAVRETRRPVATVPAQVPAEIGDFVGREAELARITELFAKPDDPGAQAVEIVGPPGIGATTFAVQAARRFRAQFPDGQFYEGIGPASDRPGGMAGVLRRMLRACGVEVPGEDVGERELSAMFRTWTADRRVLVVLDDVRHPAALRALQPAGAGSALLVTTHSRLGGIPGGQLIRLGPLNPADCIELFRKIVGERVLTEELPAVRRLVELCDGWPLAVRAAAERLRDQPPGAVRRFTRRLECDGNSFSQFGEMGRDMLTSVKETTDRLPRAARETLQVMASRGVTTLDAGEVSQELGLSETHSETVLEQLAEAQLVAPPVGTESCATANPRYRLYPLLGKAVAFVLASPDINNALIAIGAGLT